MSGRVFALLAFSCLAACNTYNDSLLTGASPVIPAGGGAGKSGGGESNGVAGSGDHGGDVGAAGDHGLGGGGHAGESGAHAGEANSGSAGSTGSAGNIGSAGMGGASGVAGGASSAGTSSAGADPGPVGEQIDDFEDQDEVILRLSLRNGPWYVVSDATTTGTVGPSMTIAPLAAADLRPGSPSVAALHLTATGFADWGAGVGADMVNQMAKKVPYDVSAYRAIRFYAKIGSGTSATVKVLLPNSYSDADGGKCSDADTKKRCGDHLFKSVSGLKTTWELYEVKFADLTQQAFGLPQTSPLDLSSVYSVQFTLANKLPVDIWLDDVTFVPK
ncbi:MAG TPA: hypothetical protein VJV79_10835 [Polyangiaceae bacterium]|nr:hypothetical protein [Polyangiaceae bacterium]